MVHQSPARCSGDVQSELNYYFLEQYLFEKVGPMFRATGLLSAGDFFLIVIWKANRAKTRVAERPRKLGPLDRVIAEVARALHTAEDRHERFTILTKTYGFRLPIASAILSVLWPDEFSVFDIRVCEEFPGQFGKLADISNSAEQWQGYERYLNAVKESVKEDLSLRDKDRVLWARSAMGQLRRDLEKWDQQEFPTQPNRHDEEQP